MVHAERVWFANGYCGLHVFRLDGTKVFTLGEFGGGPFMPYGDGIVTWRYDLRAIYRIGPDGAASIIHDHFDQTTMIPLLVDPEGHIYGFGQNGFIKTIDDRVLWTRQPPPSRASSPGSTARADSASTTVSSGSSCSTRLKARRSSPRRPASMSMDTQWSCCAMGRLSSRRRTTSTFPVHARPSSTASRSRWACPIREAGSCRTAICAIPAAHRSAPRDRRSSVRWPHTWPSASGALADAPAFGVGGSREPRRG